MISLLPYDLVSYDYNQPSEWRRGVLVAVDLLHYSCMKLLLLLYQAGVCCGQTIDSLVGGNAVVQAGQPCPALGHPPYCTAFCQKTSSTVLIPAS
jgi:hypothetical protein